MADLPRRTFLASTAALTACAADGALRARDRRPTGESPPTPTSEPTPTGTPTGTPTATTAPAGPGPEPAEPWDPPGDFDGLTFGRGLQTGDVTPTAALVSVRQHEEDTLTLVLARGVEGGWEEVQWLEDLVPDAGALQLELTGLVPDTTYSVVAYAADGVRRGWPSRFRTALPPGASRIVRFGATSCLGSPGAPWRSLSRVAEQKLDFFLLLGDTIYADEGIVPAGDWEGHWDDALLVGGLRELTASTSVVATWDDHEVDNDWTWEEAGDDALTALDAFLRALPLRRGTVGSGLWRKLSWGDAVDLFVLDCRGERIDGDYVSPEQMQWLKDGLLASTARFKIVLNSVPITDMDDVYLGLGDDDRWDGYPAQRTEILDWITDHAIPGVLWVAGDFHWGAIASIGRPGEAYDGLTEVFCGPAGSLVNPLANLAGPDHYPVVVRDWNAVTFEADPDAGTIRVVFEGDQGPLTERTLVL
jgi:alkaline phosphatase D